MAIYRHAGEYAATIEGLKSDKSQGISRRGVRQFGAEHNGWHGTLEDAEEADRLADQGCWNLQGVFEPMYLPNCQVEY